MKIKQDNKTHRLEFTGEWVEIANVLLWAYINGYIYQYSKKTKVAYIIVPRHSSMNDVQIRIEQEVK